MILAARICALWLWSHRYTVARSGLPAASRAPTKASRLAAAPPLVKSPPALSGYPTQRRNQSITTSSSWLGPLDTSQAPWLMLYPAAMKSASTLGHVGDDITSPNARGWSARKAKGRISRAACSMTFNAGRPFSGGSCISWSTSPCLNSPPRHLLRAGARFSRPADPRPCARAPAWPLAPSQGRWVSLPPAPFHSPGPSSHASAAFRFLPVETKPARRHRNYFTRAQRLAARYRGRARHHSRIPCGGCLRGSSRRTSRQPEGCSGISRS